MAKAKTPTTGGDKPMENTASRASSAAAKPKPVRKTPARTTKPAEKADQVKKPTQPAPATPAPTAAAKAPKDPTTSSTLDVPKMDSAKPAIAPETSAKAETVDKPVEKKAEPAKPATEPVKKVSTASVSPPPAAPKVEPEKSRSVFFPMVLGGIVAGAIGFAAAELNVLGLRSEDAAPATFTQDLAAQEARIAKLEQASAAPAAAPADMSGIEAAIADLSARVNEIASRPAPSAGDGPQIDTSGFEAELAGLKSSVETQRDEIAKLLENALSVEEATEKAAKAAAAQSALARIVAAISTGQPFADELAELQANGINDLPTVLAEAAETGVVTSANLQDRFPDAARASLAVARAEEPAGATGGLGNFLKNQLGARSVIPREGNDPDAILSRAEAAMREGQLAQALTEIDALPDSAKAPLADWIADAQARQAAQDAVDTLTQRLTAN